MAKTIVGTGRRRRQAVSTIRTSSPRHTKRMRVWILTGLTAAFLSCGGVESPSEPVYLPSIGELTLVPYTGGEPIPVTDGRTSEWSPTWSRMDALSLWSEDLGDLWVTDVVPD